METLLGVACRTDRYLTKAMDCIFRTETVGVAFLNRVNSAPALFEFQTFCIDAITDKVKRPKGHVI